MCSPRPSLAGRGGTLTVSPRNPELCADPAGRVHSPFSSSAAKKAARQSSRVTTGPQNQLGVQDTTNLQRQKGGGGGAAGASVRVRRGALWAGVCLGPDGQLGPVGGMAKVWSQKPGTASQQLRVLGRATSLPPESRLPYL